MALYHTYRPRTFDDVAYQSHIIETIKNQVINDKVSHAYLFSGPRGVGKTTTARILAKAVNLELKPGTAEFDDTSDAAKEINESRSIDIIEIDAASNTGVDNIREHIIENARFQPTSLKKKVFIIDEVHMLSNSAFNALLKTLEEPPAHVMFILATTELHKIPETIISRCQLFRFKRVPFEEMKKHLESILKQEDVEVDDDVLERIINKSDGCVRDAMSLLEQVLATGEKHITKDSVAMFLPTSDVSTTLAFLTALVNKDLQKALGTIHTASSDGVRMNQFIHDTLELLRVLMILKATGTYAGTGLDLSDAAKKDIDGLKGNISHPELIQLTDIVMKRKSQIATSPIAELPVEMIAIEWCGQGAAQDRDELAKSAASKETSDSRLQTPMKATPEVKNVKVLNVEPAQSIIKTESEVQSPESEIAQIKPEVQEPEIKQTSPEITSPKSEVNQDDVRKHWNAWIKAIEAYSPSLVFILKMSELAKVDKNVISILVGYGFHRDKLLDVNIKKQLETAYGELLGGPVEISVEVKEGGMPVPKDDNELTDLTAAFGGQVVG